jgi:(S)-2-hydroxy-acid oxidase
MAHPDGEIATARAAAKMNTAFTLSTIATTTMEEVAAATSPGSLRIFQLYIYRERDITRQLVARAERAGFAALMLTVDTPFFGKRRDDNRNKFKLPPHLKMANFEGLDFNQTGVNQSNKESGLNEYASSLFDASLTWKDVDWLRSVTRLPIVVKGILSAEDAVEAVNHGVAGIIVSNHGARQLDTVPATIDVLPEIVHAVGGRCEVYMDGGVRTGTDVFKAVALGARAVFIGRPAIYGLAYNGEEGVRQVLQILQTELSSAMALAGCATVEDIKPSFIRHVSLFNFSKL